MKAAFKGEEKSFLRVSFGFLFPMFLNPLQGFSRVGGKGEQGCLSESHQPQAVGWPQSVSSEPCLPWVPAEGAVPPAQVAALPADLASPIAGPLAAQSWVGSGRSAP